MLKPIVALIFLLLASAPAAAKDPFVRPEKFGAEAGDAQDDSAAVQAAIDAAARQGGAVVFAAGKTYSIQKTVHLRSGIELISTRDNSATLHGPRAARLGNMIVGEGVMNVRVKDLRFVNDHVPPDTGAGSILILGRHSHGLDIERCYFGSTPQGKNGLAGHYQLRGIALEHEGIHHVKIAGCSFEWLKFGVLTNSDSDDQRDAAAHGMLIQHDVQIVDNQFRHIAGDAIEINHPGAKGLVRDFVIARNDIEVPRGIQAADSPVITAAGFGVGVAGAGHVLVEHNRIWKCRWQGIHLEDFAHQITIRNNQIEGPGIGQAEGRASSGNLIHILNCQDVTIEDCVLRAASQSGIAIGPGGTARSRGIVVKRTKIESGGRIGIYSQSASGNLFEDVTIRDFEIGVKIFAENGGTKLSRVQLHAMRSAGLETVLPGDQFQELSGISFQSNPTNFRFAAPQMLDGKIK